MSKTLYIVHSHLFEEMFRYLNIIYHKKNIFVNGDIDILFIKSNSLYLKYENDYKLTVENIDFQGISISKNYIDSFNYLLENRYDNVKYILPFNDRYKLQLELINRLLNIDNYVVYYTNKLDSFEYDEFKNMIDINNGIKKRVDKSITNLVRKEIIKLSLNKIISNFFFQKTVERRKIDLLHLFIDRELRDLSSRYIKKVIDINNNVTHGYKLFKYEIKKNRLVTYFDNIYAYLDIFDEYDIFVNNQSSFQKINSNTIIELKNDKFVTRDKIDKIKDIENCNIKLCEFFNMYKDIYSFDEILYTLFDFYDIVHFNRYDEIIDYEPIPINFDIKIYYENIINMDDDSKIVNELNRLAKKLSISYKFKIKEIHKCPYCIDGKIYDSGYTYFCNKCDFLFYKEGVKKKYGFELKKREFRILLKRGYINMIYKDEMRVFKLVQSGKWWNLIMLRK